MGERVVLDTNVLVSALGWRGAPYEIVRQCLDGRYILLLSPETLAELERVLRYPKLRFSEAQITEYLEQLTEIAELIHPLAELSVIPDDPTDNRILECALAGQANVIVSGDGHLLQLKVFEGIPILRPQQFFERQ